MKQLPPLTGVVQAAQNIPVKAEEIKTDEVKTEEADPNADTVIIQPRITIDDLQPTGELDKVADAIKQNTPFTQEEFDLMVKEAEAAISSGSRVDGALQNITSALKQIAAVVLPIVKGAL